MGTIQEQISISAVIPTFNAAETLPEALAALRSSALIGEVIVADGGSSDETIDCAISADARVIVAPRGRGGQLAAGAAAASSDWLFFCMPIVSSNPAGKGRWPPSSRHREAEGRAGYFDLAIDDPAPAARRLEHIVAWRCRALALPYGDQGLLIGRTLYDAVGGFALLPLMEDVDLVRRLGRHRVARIGARCLASARRYRHDGYLRRPLRNLLCLSLYFAGVPPARIVRLYG